MGVVLLSVKRGNMKLDKTAVKIYAWVSIGGILLAIIISMIIKGE